MSKVLAVDWGERRIGVAVSDPTRLLARALPTIYTDNPKDAVRQVASVVTEEEVEEIVVGLPLNMDGSRGEAAESAEKMARRLREATRLPVRMWDERLTSSEARRMLRERGQRVGKDKGKIDARAAELLLQSYLDAGSPSGESP